MNDNRRAFASFHGMLSIRFGDEEDGQAVRIEVPIQGTGGVAYTWTRETTQATLLTAALYEAAKDATRRALSKLKDINPMSEELK